MENIDKEMLQEILTLINPFFDTDVNKKKLSAQIKGYKLSMTQVYEISYSRRRTYKYLEKIQSNGSVIHQKYLNYFETKYFLQIYF